jgi:hypothetical protein
MLVFLKGHSSSVKKVRQLAKMAIEKNSCCQMVVLNRQIGPFEVPSSQLFNYTFVSTSRRTCAVVCLYIDVSFKGQ